MAGIIGINTQQTAFYVNKGDNIIVPKGGYGLYKINQKNGKTFILVYYDTASEGVDILTPSSLLLEYCTITVKSGGLVLNSDTWDNEQFVLTKVL